MNAPSKPASDEAIYNLCALHGLVVHHHSETVREWSGWTVRPKGGNRAFTMNDDSSLSEWVHWVEFYMKMWSDDAKR